MHTCKAQNAVQNTVTRTRHVTGVLIPGGGHNEAPRPHLLAGMLPFIEVHLREAPCLLQYDLFTCQLGKKPGLKITCIDTSKDTGDVPF